MSDLRVVLKIGDKEKPTYLEEKEVKVLEGKVKEMNEYFKSKGLKEGWDILDEISVSIHNACNFAPEKKSP